MPSPQPEPPRILPFALTELTTEHGEGDVREGERYEMLDWAGADREFWSFTACAFRRVDITGTKLRGTHLTEVTLTELDVAALDCPRSAWQSVALSGSRIGSADVYDSSWRSVSLTGSKIDYLNARAADWQEVLFTDCTLGELDLSSARANRVAFRDCRVDTLTLSGARLGHVDLRGAELRSIAGLAGLAGAWITGAQLTELAPYLAAHLKINVDPDR